MGKREIRWLHQELPKLRDAGVLDEAATQRLQDHYGTPDETSMRRLGLVIFAIAGALLIGLGIQLVIAHNWHELSRPTRAALSIALLVLAQALAFWVLARRSSSVAWREGAATFVGLAAGASLALVSQTYHIYEDLPMFLLAWSLAGLPLVFLFDSYFVAALYVVGVTSVAGTRLEENAGRIWCWLLFLPAFVQLVRGIRRPDTRLRTALLATTVCVCLPFAVGYTVPEDGFAVFLGLVATFGAYAAGVGLLAARAQDPSVVWWRLPFAWIGPWLFVAIWLALTVDDLFGHQVIQRLEQSSPWDEGPGLDLAVAAIALLFGVLALRARQPRLALYGFAPIALFACWALSRLIDADLGYVGLNLYLLALGVTTLVWGLRSESILRLNGGLLILALLVITRFLDTDFGFLARGIAFIAVGIGFLVANLLWARRLGRTS